MASPYVEAAAERAALIGKTTTLSIVIHSELNPDEVTMLRVTLQDVVREVVKWTVGLVPFEIVQVGDAPVPKPGAMTFDSGDEGVSLDLGGRNGSVG